MAGFLIGVKAWSSPKFSPEDWLHVPQASPGRGWVPLSNRLGAGGGGQKEDSRSDVPGLVSGSLLGGKLFNDSKLQLLHSHNMESLRMYLLGLHELKTSRSVKKV